MLWDKLRGRRVLILDLEEEMQLPFIEPVVAELIASGFPFGFYATSKTGCPLVAGMKLPAARVLDFRLARFMWLADAFLSPQIWGRVPKRVLSVHLPHGHPVKFACLPKENFEHFDVHFVTGELHRKQTEFTIAHYGITRPIRIFDVGLPKSDKLMSNQYDREAELRRLGLDPSRPTVIYAPSWEEGLSLRAFGARLFEQLISLEDWNVIVKLHPASLVPTTHPQYSFYTGNVDWRVHLDSYARASCFRHIVANEIDPLLAASDVMVTDISGVALEFLCLLKPVVYVDCPEFFESTLPKIYRNFGANTADYIRNDPKSNAGRHVGLVVQGMEELPAKVRQALREPRLNESERKEYARQIRCNPGRGAKVAADLLITLLRERRDAN